MIHVNISLKNQKILSNNFSYTFCSQHKLIIRFSLTKIYLESIGIYYFKNYAAYIQTRNRTFVDFLILLKLDIVVFCNVRDHLHVFYKVRDLKPTKKVRVCFMFYIEVSVSLSIFLYFDVKITLFQCNFKTKSIFLTILTFIL